MTGPLSFDRVAEIYDATRALPPWVTGEVSSLLAAEVAAVSNARLLELGVGTGRMAVPLLQRGVSLVGVDISPAMLAKLREKLPVASTSGEAGPPAAGECALVLGDAEDLPFHDAAFDFVLAVHVFHLLPDLGRALDEVRRVLTPRGALLLAGDLGASMSVASRVRRRWYELLRDANLPVTPWPAVEESLLRHGAVFEELGVVRSETELPVAETLRRIEERQFSETWTIPEEIHLRTVSQLREWAQKEMGADAVETVPREFRIVRATLPTREA